MLNRHYARYILALSMILCVVCCLVLYPGLTSGQAQAHTASSNASGITLSTTIGFDASTYNMYHVGKWTPIHITISNHAAAFKGTLSVNTQAGSQDPSNINYRSPWKFERAITLPKATQQLFTMYVPFYYDDSLTPGVAVSVLNMQGKVVATQSVSSQFEIRPGTLLIGVISDQANQFVSLGTPMTNNEIQQPTVVRLDASTLPSMASVLDNFDILVIDNFASKTLRPNQALALETWVNRGGILIEAGGAQWQRTLGHLPANLVPVSVAGTATLPAGTQLVAPDDPMVQTPGEQILASPIPSALPIAIATPRPQRAFSQTQTVLMTGSIPLFIQARSGQGAIGYVAIDMSDSSLNYWEGLYELWATILLRMLGDQVLISSTIESYSSGPGQLLMHAGILDMIEPDTLPGPFVILALLFAYALVIGPLRLFVSRKLKRPYLWSWRIFAAGIVVFSLLSYTLALYQRNASITDNSISLLQFNQGGTSAHVTTFAGVFVPNQGDFALSTPGENLAQPIANQFQVTNSAVVNKSDQPTRIDTETDKTTLSLQGLPPWTLHYATSEQDIRLHGALATNLTVNGNKVMGTISNTLSTGLSDIYLLLPNSFIPIGHIGAGETLKINTPIYSAPQQAGKTLADQIAEYNGLPAGYFPYTHNAQPQTDEQRHVALLSSLDGAGFTFSPCQGPCKTYAVTSRGTIFITGGRVPNPGMNTYEPLLLDNAQATVIGWADQPLTNDVTINGWHPIGHHDNFFQMPVSLDLSNDTQILPGLVQGQVINLASYDAELTLPGIYTMTEGTITFELTMPNVNHPLSHGVTINEPDLWANPFGAGNPINPSHMHAQLYNWFTNTWDTVTFRQDTFTTTNTAAYVGPSGRVLLQLSNQDETLGKLYFGKPSLSLQ